MLRGEIFFSNWRYLTRIYSAIFDKTKHRKIAQIPHTNCQARWWRVDDLGLFCSHMELYSFWVNFEVLCKLKYSGWPSQGPDLKPTEMLQQDLEKAVYIQVPPTTKVNDMV